MFGLRNVEHNVASKSCRDLTRFEPGSIRVTDGTERYLELKASVPDTRRFPHHGASRTRCTTTGGCWTGASNHEYLWDGP